MIKSKIDELLKEISDQELSDMAHEWVSKICKNPRNFTMTVPARHDDTDIIFSELIRRFRTQNKLHNNN